MRKELASLKFISEFLDGCKFFIHQEICKETIV